VVGLTGIDVEQPLPHDLVELARIDAVTAGPDTPGWVVESLSRAPFAVVRRARSRDGLVPIGVRGAARHQRFAAWLSPSQIKRRIGPEDLARDETWRTTPRAASLPHFALLDRVAATMRALALTWGPAGSAGYELASGIPALTPASDIDLVVRVARTLSREIARSLLVETASLPIRIDVQIETPHGAVALAEYAAGSAPIVLRTLDGPRLVADPWTSEIFGDHPR
jgi:phosphoribosyl-dephospho-CoA transferase